MIKIGDKQFRNLEEQVRRNQDDIKYILEEEGVLNQFGIKVVGQVDTQGELPDASTYQGDYGDAYAVGTQPPYELYIYTREFSGETGPQWFNIGEFPAPSTVPGPTGAVGPTGPAGTRGSKWESGPTVPSSIIGYNLGDQYLVTGDGDVYEVRSGGWVNTGSVRGPQGIQGIQGPQGPTGVQGPQGPQGIKGDAGQSFEVIGIVSNESQLPTPSTLPDNQAYLVGTAAPYDMYVQVNEQWVNAGFVQGVVGPQGPQGPQGIQGPVGPTGPIGPTGPQGEGIDDLLNGTEIAKKAEQDAQGNNIVDTYAKQNGNYPNMTVGNATNAVKATQDSNGNNIADTYAQKNNLLVAHYITVDLVNTFHFVCTLINKSTTPIGSKRTLLQALQDIGNSKGVAANGFLLHPQKGGVIYEIIALSSIKLRIRTVAMSDVGSVNTFEYDSSDIGITVSDVVVSY